MGTRAGGNPLFAIQLIGDWVDRGLLEVAEQGFRLRADATAALPDDIHALWQRRIARLVSQFGAPAQQALELAAALGNEVDRVTWHSACGDMAFLLRLQDRLVELRLARETLRGWTFAHGMLRESLERTARESAHWEAHHLACAEAIRKVRGDTSALGREDFALHLLAGGRSSDAVDPLMKAAKRHRRRANFPRAMELCQTREEVLQQLDVDPGDPRYLEGYLLQARLHFEQGNFDAAASQLDRAEANANFGAADPIRAGMFRTRARVLRMTGDLPQALDLSERASAEFGELGDELSASTCDLITARLHFESTGDHQRALELVTTAERRFLKAGDEGNLAEAHYISALLHQALGDEAAALTATERARVRYRSVGERFGEAACENFIGEVARQTGAFAEAEDRYRSAARILDSIGSKWTYVMRMNVSLAQVQDGRFTEAERAIQALREETFEGRDALQCYTDYALMACAAADQRWPEFDRLYQACYAVRPDTGRVDKDLAELARIAGEGAASGGRQERAERCLRLAIAHQKALSDTAQVQALTARLAALTG